MYPYGSGSNNLSPNNYGQPNANGQQRLTPQQGSFMPGQINQGSLGVPQQNRGVYTSMIQPQNSAPSSSKPMGGFGGLAGMGRVVREQPDPVIRVNEAPNNPPMQSPNTLSFRPTGDKPKMANSMIFPQQQNPNPFSNTGTGGFGTSRLESMVGKGKSFESNTEESTESAEEKRKREIGNIKEELNKLNKRMENFSFKQPDPNNPNKQYFQLPTRKSAIQQPPSPQEQGGSGGHFDMFKAYSGGGSSNTSNNSSSGSSPGYGGNSYGNSSSGSGTSSGSGSVQSWQSKPQETGYLQVKQEPQIQHSLSANELRKPEFKREETGTGMFKKKNAMFEPQAPQSGQAPRSFMLSPKSHNTNTGMPPKPTTPKVAEFKAAEVVEIPQPKRTVKRVDSTTYESQQQPFTKEEPQKRQFKRSDFIVGKKMGKGQFGEVMMVVHKDTGFLCAMKVMSKKQIKEDKYENQIARELSIQFYLSHRNVSPLYGYFTDEQNIYLLVEFATGGQLLQMLRKAHRMEEADCSPIIRQICQGLNYIHNEQIIHRDIKPENILFNFDTVKICDFGWAVHSGNGMRKTVAGSPLYYSPEVVLETKYDEKIDIWAIGMMTYECLLGKIPFRIYSELDLNRIVEDQIKFPEYIDTTEEVRDFILKICKKDPDERMEMRDIMRHPFITKYQNKRKIAPQILEEFKKLLSN